MGDASAGRFRLTGHSSHFSPSSASLAAAQAAAFQSSQVAARTPPSRLHLHLQKVLTDTKFLNAAFAVSIVHSNAASVKFTPRPFRHPAARHVSWLRRQLTLTHSACQWCYLHYETEERTQTTRPTATAESQQLDSFNHLRLIQRCSCSGNSFFFSFFRCAIEYRCEFLFFNYSCRSACI